MTTRQEIKEYAQKIGAVKTSDVVSKFDVSRQYASKILNDFVVEKYLIKVGSTRRAFYVTEKYAHAHQGMVSTRYSKTLSNKNIEEHMVFEDVVKHFAPYTTLSENIKSIFEYAFSEMMNNAIDHSMSEKIKCTVILDKDTLSFVVEDFGIGVFRNIMEKRKLESEIDAIQDLLKGKMTTAPKLHSGEGIFFTSKVGDRFVLDSYGYQLVVDTVIKDVFIKKVTGQKQGTRVTFHINTDKKHHLNDIFKKYTNTNEESDFGFDKTEIRVRLYTMGGVHISRSQARRVLTGLEKFKVIVMDYDRVPTVGQAFADEIYRVFKQKRPDIEIQDINMNEAVRFMVERAKNEAKKQ